MTKSIHFEAILRLMEDLSSDKQRVLIEQIKTLNDVDFSEIIESLENLLR